MMRPPRPVFRQSSWGGPWVLVQAVLPSTPAEGHRQEATCWALGCHPASGQGFRNHLALPKHSGKSRSPSSTREAVVFTHGVQHTRKQTHPGCWGARAERHLFPALAPHPALGERPKQLMISHSCLLPATGPVPTGRPGPALPSPASGGSFRCVQPAEGRPGSPLARGVGLLLFGVGWTGLPFLEA